MTQPSRWGFARLARVAAAGLAVVLFSAGQLAAQGTTGKIEGLVREPSGAPIGGAQIRIVGSAYAATTNEQGYYFINNVPAGVKVIRGQYIGYAPAEVRNVRVLAGQTMTVNLTLEQRATEVTGITITVEQNPLVPRDQVTTKAIVQGDLIAQLPADNIREVLRLQPGVVEGQRGLVIRGGRPREAALYIDGVLVRNMGAQFVSIGYVPMEVQVGTNAVEEVSVTRGAIGAEFGDAQSGVISLVTRAGGPTFSGSLSYVTDEISGQTYGQGLHRVEASVGGPISRNLTFFLATTLQSAQTLQSFRDPQNGRPGKGSEDVPVYVLDGLDTSDPLAPNGYVLAPVDPGDPLSDSVRVDIPRFTRYSDGSRLPDDAGDNYTFSTKLQYSFGAGSRTSVTFHRSRIQDRYFRGRHLYNPQAQQGGRRISNAFVLNWTQVLSASAQRALSLDANLSWQRDEFVFGVLDPQWLEDHRDPFANFTLSSLQFITDFDDFPVDDELVRNFRTNNCDPSTGGRCIPYLNRDELNTSGAFRTNPYGVTAGDSYFASRGFAGAGGLWANLSREMRVTGRAVLDWQANRHHRVKLGGDFTRADIRAGTFRLNTTIFGDAYKETPLRYGLFGQDRIDLGDVVIEFGLRYDRLNSGVMYPITPSRVYSDPLRTGDYSWARTAADSAFLAPIAQRCAALLAANDTTGWSTCNFVEAPVHTALSPSVRVSFPITDRTGFRLSYAHQTQTPDFSLLASGVNVDINSTNTNQTFGRDLIFGRSIIFEFGIRHAFSPDIVLDVAAYNKDKVSDITTHVLGIYDPAFRADANINMVLNADFGNARGIEVQLDRRIGQVFQGRLGYTYQSARGTGSDPFEYLNTLARQVSTLTGTREPPPTALLTTRDNRTHTIAGTASLTFPHGWRSGTTWGSLLQDVGMFATYQLASGLSYTPLVNVGRGQQGPGTDFGLGGTQEGPLNSSTMPWIRNADLRVTRGFRLAGRDLTVYADFRNLFNFSNLDAIWSETGDVRNQLHRTKAIDPINRTLSQDAGNLLETRSVTRGGVTQDLWGYNLTDCSQYQYRSDGTAGLPDCLFLRGAERRFGDGDGFFDVDEQATAFNAWYDLFNGPHTLRGPGFNLRIGFEFNF